MDFLQHTDKGLIYPAEELEKYKYSTGGFKGLGLG